MFAQEFLKEEMKWFKQQAEQLGCACFSPWKLTWSHLVTGQDSDALESVFCFFVFVYIYFY